MPDDNSDRGGPPPQTYTLDGAQMAEVLGCLDQLIAYQFGARQYRSARRNQNLKATIQGLEVPFCPLSEDELVDLDAATDNLGDALRSILESLQKQQDDLYKEPPKKPGLAVRFMAWLRGGPPREQTESPQPGGA